MMIFIIAGGLLLVSLLTFLLFKHVGLYHKFKKMSKTYEEKIQMLENIYERNHKFIIEQNKTINELLNQIEGNESK